MSDKLVKEAVMKILKILASAEPASDVVMVSGGEVQCQYVISSYEMEQCGELLIKLNGVNNER